MLAECPRCGVAFNTEQEGLVTCGICGNWFYAYEEDEDDEDELCLTPLASDAADGAPEASR